jgi:hypothetical protein
LNAASAPRILRSTDGCAEGDLINRPAEAMPLLP